MSRQLTGAVQRVETAVVRKNEIPLLRSLLHKAIFVMQAAEHGSLRNPVWSE